MKSADPVECARLQRVEASSYEDMATWEDEETLTPAAACRVPQGEGEPILERSCIEHGETVLYQWQKAQNGTWDEVELYRLKLGGLLPHMRRDVPMFIKANMVRLQMALSMGMTMQVKNTELAGFVERWLHNVRPAKDGDGNPIPIVHGPGQTLVTEDRVAVDKETGEPKVLGKADYQRLEPVSSDATEAAISRAREEFYASAHQQHYLMGSDATASGESRKTAMAGFANSIRPYATAYKEALRDLLVLWVRMSCALAGKPGILDGVEIDVRLTDTVTQPTAQDRAQSLAELQAGRISHERFLQDRGITDPAAERQQIALEEEQAIEATAKLAEKRAAAGIQPSSVPADQSQGGNDAQQQ